MYKIYIKDTLLVLIDSKDLKKTKSTMGDELVAKYSGKKKYLLNFIDKAISRSCGRILSPFLRSLRLLEDWF